MRLLVGSDFHLGPLCDAFERRLTDDVLPIHCGDLVNRPREDADSCTTLLERWSGLNPDFVFVPGNHEPEDCGHWEGVQIHERRGLRILAVPVIPIMYKIPTWTHEYSESTIAAMVKPFEGAKVDVVASHSPPHGVCDRASWGEDIGSRALKDFAETLSFRLWVCGHVHEQRAGTGTIAGRPLRNAAKAILEMELAAG